ncbi:uncharacterized protein LOC133330703 [Musca vetustissima]|uniref:uncharacterized protein LOC133330703 n=1 Tax=Musca vetustissima TaxID=27455 RepID=UPI002AB5E4BC|nr:uncharacterized protein LOC133330703 [Musca vetustissima]
MDSRLLNVVYDDPFDGNFTKYDNDTDFWSSGASDTMGMQLTETLHGILPIAPTDDFGKEENVNALGLQSGNKNAFSYEDFAGQHLTAGGAIEIVTVDPNADGYDSDESDDDDDEDDDDGDVIQTNAVHHNGLIEFDRQSQCSNLTFRTRTDSSSIGDYESHTSDYDDSDDEDDDDDDDHLISPDENLILDTTSYHKNRTISTNTINSDVDGLGLNIDASNFDLAEFITKDDFTLNPINEDDDDLSSIAITNHGITATAATTTSSLASSSGGAATKTLISSSKTIDSDSESDIIVDVETVEADDDDDNSLNSLRKASDLLKPQMEMAAAPAVMEPLKPQQQEQQQEEDITFVDNTTKDPSWSPPGPQQTSKKLESVKNEEKSSKSSTPNRNITLVPNKKQCDLLKGKFGKGKAAKVVNHQKPPAKVTKTNPNATSTAATHPHSAPAQERKTGIGMGGKNLALLRYHERSSSSISEPSSEENTTPIKIQNPIKIEQKAAPLITTTPSTTMQVHKKEQQEQETTATTSPQMCKSNRAATTTTSSPQKVSGAAAAAACKRKLNLEEYKKRRGDTTPLAMLQEAKTKLQSYKIPKLEDKSTTNKQITPTTQQTQKHSEAVKSVVKTLKEQQQQQQQQKIQVVDPITEAKNKVLRMQELKKAQQMRIIDSTISAKVPRVTKLPPLREIVKDSPYFNDADNATQSFKCHPDYEEIIIVSASCNTDISIPPIPNSSIQPVNTATRSLLKSSALLSSITNTFQKVKAVDNGKISTSSLIASIQDVVVKKTLPVENSDEDANNTTSSASNDAQQKSEQHGEDKIIMHLRKDRIRKRTSTIAIQTDLQPEFPPLPLPKGAMQHKSRERMRKHRKRQYRKHKDTTLSSLSSEYSSDEQSDHSNASSILRSRDNSSSSSIERMRTYDSAIGTGGYSSRSSRKHRSSMSSSYSESLDREARGRRQRRTSYKQRSSRKLSSGSPYSSSTSYTSDSDRSRSPLYRRSRSRSTSRGDGSRSRRSSYRQNKKNFVDRNVSQPAVEERRIVYVGRIEQETTKDMLRRKFLPYGTIKQISIHYKDTGMKYGFVTFERSQDAFNAIDNSTRDPQINMYDVSFGGRRAFCRASYADLDNAGINTYQSYVFPQQQQQPKEEDSFEALLMKMKAKLSANKNTTSAAPQSSSSSPTIPSSSSTSTTTTPLASTDNTNTNNNNKIANGKI